MHISSLKQIVTSKQALPVSAKTSFKCKKCHEVGHYTFECKNKRAYTKRPTRTQLLKQKTRQSEASEQVRDGLGVADEILQEKAAKRRRESDSSSTDSSSSGSDTSDSD